MNEQNIKFSILTPVYNVEQYLPECIESVLGQTYPNFEFILVDDGSTDMCGKICDEYAGKDSRIKVFHKENEGLMATRRFAITKASGDYYIFLDSDDYIKLNTLEIICKTIIDYECDCVVYGFDRVCNGEIYTTVTEEKVSVFQKDDKSDLYKKVFLNDGYNSLCRKAIKRTLVSEYDFLNYYHISVGEDVIQSVEIWSNFNKAVFIPDVLYQYRLNLNSIVNTITPENYKFNFIAYKYVYDFVLKQNVFTEEDFYDYYGYLVKVLCSDLILISIFETDYSKKKYLFEQIRNKELYAILKDKKFNRKYSTNKIWFLYKLYENNFFRTLIVLCKAYYNIKYGKRNQRK